MRDDARLTDIYARVSDRQRMEESVEEAIEHAVALLCEAVDDREVSEAEPDSDPTRCERLVREMLRTLYRGSVVAVFTHAESEIERRFLNAMLLGFLISDPFGLVIVAPKRDAPAWIANQREAFSAVRELQRQIRAGGHPPGSFDRYVDYLVASHGLAQEEADGYRAVHTFGEFVGGAFHLIMQPGFPRVRVADRSIRTDGLVYVPDDPAVQVVLECDGYAWHGNPQSFTRDRQRDRALLLAGYQVLRFSGSEVMRDPVSVSAEFAGALQRARRAPPPS